MMFNKPKPNVAIPQELAIYWDRRLMERRERDWT